MDIIGWAVVAGMVFYAAWLGALLYLMYTEMQQMSVYLKDLQERFEEKYPTRWELWLESRAVERKLREDHPQLFQKEAAKAGASS